MKKQTIIYVRVSTIAQGYDSQLQELRNYASGRGLIVSQTVLDTVSGSQACREGLDALMREVRHGRVGIILVHKLDRLARSLSHLAHVLGELRAHGTALICPSQGIDTTNANPAAHLQLNILGAVAEFERELIRERVMAGIHAARQRGVKLGRPRTTDRLLPEVQRLALRGLKQKSISEALDIPFSTAGELLRAVREARVHGPADFSSK
jgi:putative DNA-invertase from lambdoid prophage Rac